MTAPRTDPTLYRKYRPSSFRDVAGQEHVLRILRGAFERRRIAHAYLFSGPRGTGKTTVARLLAKRLNCRKPKELEPCGSCASCAAVSAGNHLDMIEIDAASNRGIDDVRALKERIALRPAGGGWKVYIVDEVHMLSKDAFNALLKTLEEPPPHVVFVLATTELEKVPDTVRSRCQTLVFRRAPIPVLMEKLERVARAEKIDIDANALRTIAGAAGGCFRDAESLLAMVAGVAEGTLTETSVTQVLGITPLPFVQEFIQALFDRQADRALSHLQSLTDRGYSPAEFMHLLVRYLRALAVFAVAGVHAEAFSPDEDARFQNQARVLPLADLVSLIRLTLRAKYELRDAVYEELPLEMLILEWCASATKPRVPEPQSTPQRHAEPVLESAQAREREVTPAQKMEASVSLDQIIEVWPAFLRAASMLHPLLLPMFAHAIPLATRDRTLYLLCDHPLAHDRLKQTEFRQQLEKRLQACTGQPVLIRLVREQEMAVLGFPSPESGIQERIATMVAGIGTAPEPAVGDTLDILGGEVVRPASLTP